MSISYFHTQILSKTTLIFRIKTGHILSYKHSEFNYFVNPLRHRSPMLHNYFNLRGTKECVFLNSKFEFNLFFSSRFHNFATTHHFQSPYISV
eukprot:UN03704